MSPSSNPDPPTPAVLLLLDIGNTHTHAGLAKNGRILRTADFTTPGWTDGSTTQALTRFLARHRSSIRGSALASVVPKATPHALHFLNSISPSQPLNLSARNARGIGIHYPNPASIGADRLANAIAANRAFGAPSLVVDFGTAVTFDVVDAQSRYIGGVIAPGISAMTDYLHEKTALLPRIRLRDTPAVIGHSTRQAMLIGAVHGYRGLVRELVTAIQKELRSKTLPVIATGGYAELIARKLPLITAVRPHLTLEGLLTAWTLTHATPRASRAGLASPPRLRNTSSP